MSSIRAKFIRGEEVKFISHLDLMKVFERALRRSGIPILYSKGFNPHPQLVFGLPLPVGVTSEAEYLDLELEEPVNPHEFMNRLNSCLPKGIALIDAKEKKTKENIMATVVAASYEILTASSKFKLNEVRDLIKKFMELEEIVVKKQTKRKIQNVNIRPMIYNIDTKITDTKIFIDRTEGHAEKEEYPEDALCKNAWVLKYIENNYEEYVKSGDLENNIFCFSALLSAGSSANLNPVLLVEALNDTFDGDFDIIKIHRTGLFTGSKDKPVNPLN